MPYLKIYWQYGSIALALNLMLRLAAFCCVAEIVQGPTHSALKHKPLCESHPP